MRLMQSGEVVDLTIDEAGKVWSAKLEGSANDPDLVEAAKGWSFVPAFKGGRAVACSYRMTVSPAM
jgi:outer membrane biosynthesis protein TonB